MTRDHMMNIRCNTEEKRKFDKAAKEAGLPTAQWARVILRCAAGLSALKEQLKRVFR